MACSPSEGSFWLRQRRLAAGAFQHRTDRQLWSRHGRPPPSGCNATWQDGETRDIHADMMQVTLDIVARTLFGADVTDQSHEIGESLLLAIRSFGAQLQSPRFRCRVGFRRAAIAGLARRCAG